MPLELLAGWTDGFYSYRCSVCGQSLGLSAEGKRESEARRAVIRLHNRRACQTWRRLDKERND